MQEHEVAVAIERVLRDQLVLTDQPRAALRAIAEELFAALDGIAGGGSPQAEAFAAIRSEFSAAFAKVWREYCAGETLPPMAIPAQRAELRMP